ncbi:TIM-barrel protein, nifR3 family, partial [mine drainage metagenome]
DNHLVAPFLANRLEQVGIAAVTVHGRTTEMRFHGAVRLDAIAAVVAAVHKIPIIGNGDIRTPKDAKYMMAATGCAGVMIGRAALAAPWIFRDVQHYLQTGEILAPPSLEEKCRLMRDHFYNMIRFRNQRVAILEFRKRVSWYAKHINPCRILRDAMRVIDSVEDFEAAINNFLSWRREWESAHPGYCESLESREESET